MFQITIFFLYLAAALAFAISRLQAASNRERVFSRLAFFACAVAVVIHGRVLAIHFLGSGSLALSNAVSMIGMQLGLIALLAAFEARLRGLSGGMLLLAAILALATNEQLPAAAHSAISWQLRAHVLTSMFAYGLLTVGTIVAIYALIQDRRLQHAKLSALNALFAPLETSEKLLYAITTAGFIVLALSVVSGVTFIENLFAQHLVHKTTLSLLALLLFGILLVGRRMRGWRGRRAIYLYLVSFAILCLAYFGSRFVLEEILGRSWS